MAIGLVGPLWRCLLVASLALASAAPAAAATPRPWTLPSDTVFQHYNSTGAVNLTAMVQDGQGFIWLGSDAGLLRWDGYRFHTYEADPDAHGSVPDNDIRCLHVDSRGRLWVGTNSGGLAWFDADKDEFVRVPLFAAAETDNTIADIADDGGDGLFVATRLGVARIDGATRQAKGLSLALPRGGATALVHDRQGALWIGTRAGLFRVARDGALAPWHLPRTDARDPAITALLEDSAGRIWAGTKLHGAFVVDAGATRVVRESQTRAGGAFADGLESERVTALAEPRDGEVWIGTYDGIVRVDAATGRTWRERHDVALPGGLANDEIHAMLRDHDGMVWVATSVDLCRHDPRQLTFETIFGGLETGRVVGHYNVPSIGALADGRIWIAVGEGGVDIIDPSVGRVGRLRPDAAHPDAALPKGRVTAIAQAADGPVYLGTQAGLYRAGADGRKVRRVLVPQRNPTNAIQALLFDRQRLWVGGEDGVWEVSLTAAGAPVLRRHLEAELGSSVVTALARGTESTLWIGTSNGLVELDLESGRATRLPTDPTDRARLPGGYISSLLMDRKGRLWVSVFGRGIQVEQGREPDGTRRFRRLGPHDGLPQNSVDLMLMDRSGKVWASTDAGIARIDPDRMTVRAYRKEQGLGITDYWVGSGAVTAAGDLLFGGLSGVTVVHPDRPMPPSEPPPLLVTEARVGEHHLPVQQVLAARALTISAPNSGLMVEFAALDYADPDHVRYSYRLLGFDPAWTDTPASRRLATFTNLPPGDYTLQLRAAAADGQWTTPLDLAVHRHPTWYQRTSVRAAGIALALAALAGMVHLRTLFLRRRQRELQRLVAERTAELERRTQELRRSQEQLERMAYFDPLTGLANRRMFNDELRRMVAQSARGQGDFALLLLDLDHFKQINDQRGHDVGDSLLVAMAERLASHMREADRVARLGGDEFAVLLAQPCTAEAIEAACTRLLSHVDQPLFLAGESVRISASIGVAICAQQGNSPGALYKAADLALYEAKRAGRNTWRHLCADACVA